MSNDQQWQSIESAPCDRALELAVMDAGSPHALVFPCRKTEAGWVNAETDSLVKISPTHWRYWRGSETN